jgi:DNA-directed RNA polymerase specialized sigma24 family protein
MTTAPTDWNNPEVLDTQLRIITARVKRRIRWFDGIGRVSFADLVQDALLRVQKAHARFDRKKATYNTFVGMLVDRELMDRLRRIRSDDARADAHGRAAVPKESLAEPKESGRNINRTVGNPATVELAAAAASVCRATLGGRRGRGPRVYPLHQIAAALVVRRHRKLSRRGLLHLLGTDAAIRSALGMVKVPGMMTVQDAQYALGDRAIGAMLELSLERCGDKKEE